MSQQVTPEVAPGRVDGDPTGTLSRSSVWSKRSAGKTALSRLPIRLSFTSTPSIGSDPFHKTLPRSLLRQRPTLAWGWPACSGRLQGRRPNKSLGPRSVATWGLPAVLTSGQRDRFDRIALSRVNTLRTTLQRARFVRFARHARTQTTGTVPAPCPVTQGLFTPSTLV